MRSFQFVRNIYLRADPFSFAGTIESQGKKDKPALEDLYRHTAACIVELGRRGVGEAAFADMPRELLDAL